MSAPHIISKVFLTLNRLQARKKKKKKKAKNRTPTSLQPTKSSARAHVHMSQREGERERRKGGKGRWRRLLNTANLVSNMCVSKCAHTLAASATHQKDDGENAGGNQNGHVDKEDGLSCLNLIRHQGHHATPETDRVCESEREEEREGEREKEEEKRERERQRERQRQKERQRVKEIKKRFMRVRQRVAGVIRERERE
jgi:hypothetical protein